MGGLKLQKLRETHTQKSNWEDTSKVSRVTIRLAVSILFKKNGVPGNIPASTGRDQGVFLAVNLILSCIGFLSAAMAFWKGNHCVLAITHGCCNAVPLELDMRIRKEGGRFCQNEQGPRETAQRERETPARAIHIYIHTICGPRIQTHSRPSTETRTLVLLGASSSNPRRDMLDTA